jgi:hypothetical protein
LPIYTTVVSGGLRNNGVRDNFSSRSEPQTDQQVPSIGGNDKDMVVNADGSVDVWFSPTAGFIDIRAGCELISTGSLLFSLPGSVFLGLGTVHV